MPRLTEQVLFQKDLALEILEWVVFLETANDGRDVCDVLDDLRCVCTSWNAWIRGLPVLRHCWWLFRRPREDWIRPAEEHHLLKDEASLPLLSLVEKRKAIYSFSIPVSVYRPVAKMTSCPTSNRELVGFGYPCSNAGADSLMDIARALYPTGQRRGVASGTRKYPSVVDLLTHSSKDLNNDVEWPPGSRRTMRLTIRWLRFRHRLLLSTVNFSLMDWIPSFEECANPPRSFPLELGRPE
jgi:hypothetical protein